MALNESVALEHIEKHFRALDVNGSLVLSADALRDEIERNIEQQVNGEVMRAVCDQFSSTRGHDGPMFSYNDFVHFSKFFGTLQTAYGSRSAMGDKVSLAMDKLGYQLEQQTVDCIVRFKESRCFADFFILFVLLNEMNRSFKVRDKGQTGNILVNFDEILRWAFKFGEFGKRRD